MHFSVRACHQPLELRLLLVYAHAMNHESLRVHAIIHEISENKSYVLMLCACVCVPTRCLQSLPYPQERARERAYE